MAPPVGGYIAWYDAQAITGVSDGTVLTNWPDSSGNSRPLNTHLGTPTYYNTTTAKLINGHPAVFFNGDGWMATTAAITQAQPFTIFAVAKSTTASGAHSVWGISSDLLLFFMTGGVWKVYAGTQVAGGASDTNLHVFTCNFNGASSVVRVDGANNITGNFGGNGFSANQFDVGNETNSGTTSAWSGPVGEVIVYPSSLSPTDMASVESYLSSRWSATVTVSGTAAVNLGPLAVAAASAEGGCARGAWLVLGATTVPLEDTAAGYFCQNLDIGFPTVREVVNNRPDRDGVDDRTQYMGSRVVTAQVTALAGAGAAVDTVATLFAPFMLPSARPVLHYVLDRPGRPERTLTLRGAGYAWPVAGGNQRDIQLQWVAADPVSYDPNTQSVTATPATAATLSPNGDVPARPVFQIIGPITAPKITFTPAGGYVWQLAFLATFTIAAGHYVTIDLKARTVYLDGNPSFPRLSSIDWTQSSWQWIPAGTATVMALSGSGTTSPTAVQASWQDGYLT